MVVRRPIGSATLQRIELMQAQVLRRRIAHRLDPDLVVGVVVLLLLIAAAADATFLDVTVQGAPARASVSTYIELP
jgi:hypothetical protein